MNWYQAVLTIFLGNVIVLVPMVLNAHAGTKYGIPFPVYCRPSFGILGANVPAVLRALVACGWFGIQTWIGGAAIYSCSGIAFPAMVGAPALFEGLNGAQWGCFRFFWAINMFVIYKGVESIRVLLNVKAPLLIFLGLALLAWAYVQAGGFGLMLSTPSAFAPGQPKAGQFWLFFFPALTAMIGFWATLSLNIPDFSRYAKSQKDQMWGQALGLPLTMGLYSFIGVAVTSATIVIYGKKHMGSRRIDRQLQKSHRPHDRAGLAGLGDSGDEHRGQRRGPGQRLRSPLAGEHRLPHRRLYHGRDRHPHPTVEADRGTRQAISSTGSSPIPRFSARWEAF